MKKLLIIFLFLTIIPAFAGQLQKQFEQGYSSGKHLPTDKSLQVLISDDIRAYYDNKGSMIGVLLYQADSSTGFEKQTLNKAANNILNFNFTTQKSLPYIDIPDEKYINFSIECKEVLGAYNTISRYKSE